MSLMLNAHSLAATGVACIVALNVFVVGVGAGVIFAASAVSFVATIHFAFSILVIFGQNLR